MAETTSLLPYKDTKNNRENQAFPRLFSHKKAPSRHKETEAAMTSVSYSYLWGTDQSPLILKLHNYHGITAFRRHFISDTHVKRE